jgi:membrane-associated phospholipid phosphatase
MWRIFGRRGWALLVWIYPGVTAVAVMSTGNHWLVDVVGGLATIVVSTLIADRWQGWWTARQARRALSSAGSRGGMIDS